MRETYTIRFNTSKKTENERRKFRIYCKNCKHSIVFTPTSKCNKIICSYCKHYVYKNDKEEFKELLKGKIRSGKQEFTRISQKT